MVELADIDIDFGDIFFRDELQFELKSDFLPHEGTKKNIFTQELFIFIPTSLQINQGTYGKTEFYRDQTNYIRYKTPVFTFQEILDKNNPLSPLHILNEMLSSKSFDEDLSKIEHEIKLLGNIFRSTLREKVDAIIESEKNPASISQLAQEVRGFLSQFAELRQHFQEHHKTPSMRVHFQYVYEFITFTIHGYFSLLTDRLRKKDHRRSIDQELVSILSTLPDPFSLARPNQQSIHLDQTEKNRQAINETQEEKISEQDEEDILHRRGLLNKFIGSVLMLQTNRFSFQKTFRPLIAAYSAGVAMLIFMILFVWGGEQFKINTTPFIIATVFFYILKDQIKEGLRNWSYRFAFRWFPDYTTQIISESGAVVGSLKESFSLFPLNKIPKEIKEIRDRGFHTILDKIHRPEIVLHHKKNVEIYDVDRKPRRKGLNVIFRFNIQNFIKKASNAFHYYLTVNAKSGELQKLKLPKVYHLNIIMKNAYVRENKEKITEFKKYRIVIDKKGIKRVEQLE
ncbi:MAG: hypothetical protein Tsb0021_11480 [Chlamydiales bacterium]